MALKLVRSGQAIPLITLGCATYNDNTRIIVGNHRNYDDIDGDQPTTRRLMIIN